MPRESSKLRVVLAYAPLSLIGLVAGVTWAIFLNGGFRSILAWIALMSVVPILGLLLALATIIQTIRKRRRLGRLLATVALAVFCVWPASGIGAIRYPFHLETTHPSATVRLPTDAPMRVIWGGDDVSHNHHASLPDQRWAYDLAVAPLLVGSSRLEDYGCWGTPVVAPVSGVVRVAHDGEPDQVPGKPSNDRTAPLGNHVAIALDGGGYLVIAHLQAGSVVAREGETIREGAPLGTCGNSGNTSEPHVHIHAQRQDPQGRPINFSEGLPLFFRDHDGAAMPLGGVDRTGHPTGAVVRHVGSHSSGAAAK